MTEINSINLKTFPIIKVISASLFIIGAILTYFLASSPQTMLFQIGGIAFNLIAGVFPLLCGIVLLIYAFLTNYEVNLKYEESNLSIKSKKSEISLKKEDILAVRVRDAGKFAIWFVFVFVNFFFVYYGIECVLYFSANHNAGLLEYSFYSILIIWIGAVLLVLFPRKIIIILTKEKAILQKVNHLPKDGSFVKIFDNVFKFDNLESSKNTSSNDFLLRLMIGIAAISIFTITSMLIEIDGIAQPLHDLGIFIPVFLLLFGVLMISIGTKEPKDQKIIMKENQLKIEDTPLTEPLTGRNILWLRSSDKIDKDTAVVKGFRRIKVYGYLLVFVMFGQATFLAFKILWLPLIYIEYFDWIDLLIGIIILFLIFLFSFDIRQKLAIKSDSEFNFVREIIILDYPEDSKRKGFLKERFLTYNKEFRAAMKNDKIHVIKIILSGVASIALLTIIFVIFGFVVFLFI